MSKPDKLQIEALEDLMTAQQNIIDEQSRRMGKAVDMLEELVFKHDDLEEDVEEIMKVLTYGS